MKHQRKIAKGLGDDTHVRDQFLNRFKSQSHSTYSMMAGEVESTQPEPIFKQSMVTVKFSRGGKTSTVAYPGAFKDPLSGNVHGLYEGPIPGQMVMVGFENGNSAAPFVVNRYPYQGVADTTTELEFINPLTKAQIDATDVVVGHFSGSFLSFNTGILSGKLPGSADLKVISDFNVAVGALFSVQSVLATTFLSDLGGQVEIGDGVNITGSAAHVFESDLTGKVSIGAGVEISGADAHTITSDLSGAISVGALLKLENTAYSLGELVTSLIDTISGLTTTPAAVGAPCTLNPATIALLEAEKLKFALLLE